MSSWIEIVTTAAFEYDGEWTRRLCDNFGTLQTTGKVPAQTIRLVAVWSKEHAAAQREVYMKAMLFSMFKDRFIQESVTYPDYYIRVEKPEMWYYYASYNFEDTIEWGSEAAVIHLMNAIERVSSYPHVSLSTSDGGLHYKLVVRGREEKFKVIQAELNIAYREAVQIVAKESQLPRSL